MISCTVNGELRSILSWTLRVPEQGGWRAHINIESTDTVPEKGQAVTLADTLGNEWVGVARGVTSSGAVTHVEIIGGKDGLNAPTIERFYASSLDAYAVLTDLCVDAGETASFESIADLPQWRTRGEILRNEIHVLAAWTTGYWRVLP